MTTTFELKVQAIFAELSEVESGQRERRLIEACGGDERLEAEVRSLLLHHESAARFLDTPAIVESLGERGCVAERPLRIGSYEVLSVLGEGGMGVVYLARQENPRRTVALKVLPPWSAGPSGAKRFEREAQLLGRLQHAGIAQIFEAGVADTGFGPQPYFAMEHLDGVSLLRYASEHTLAIDARLRLFADVCDAVQHAHERGVLHRDLKPGNVLVVETSGGPQAKVLDFGIARAVDDDAYGDTLRTGAGQILGTLAYMSPEQSSGTSEAVDFRSDVYSLGVLGYELVGGRLPLDVANRSLTDAVRAIREVDAPPLRSIAPHVHGDVETILTKCLEKDPVRRYSSAAELSRDVRRFLAHEPIEARPQSRIYVVSRFARRHRMLVGSATAVFVVLVAGIAGTSWQAVRASDAARLASDEATRANDATALALERLRDTEAARSREAEERRNAERATARASGVSRYFLEMLMQARPSRPGETGPEVRLIDVVDRAAATLPGPLASEPDVEADVHYVLGKIYRSLGALASAGHAFRRCVELRRSAHGGDDPQAFDALASLGAVHVRQDRLVEAEVELTTALEGLTRGLGTDHPTRLDCLENLGLLRKRQGRSSEAVRGLREALELRARRDGEESAAWGSAAGQLAAALMDSGELEEAEELLERSLSIAEAADGALHPDTLTQLGNMASLLRLGGRPAEAEAWYRRALASSEQVLGKEHIETVTLLNNLAGSIAEQNRPADATPLLETVVERCTHSLGREHGDTIVAVGNLALALDQQGRFAEAEPLHRRASESADRVLGPLDPRTFGAKYNLATLLLQTSRAEEALPLFREVARDAGEVLPPDHFNLALFEAAVGACLMRLGRFTEAEPHMLSGYETMDRSLGAFHPRTRQAAQRLTELYDTWGQAEKAAEWRLLAEVRAQ